MYPGNLGNVRYLTNEKSIRIDSVAAKKLISANLADINLL